MKNRLHIIHKKKLVYAIFIKHCVYYYHLYALYFETLYFVHGFKQSPFISRLLLTLKKYCMAKLMDNIFLTEHFLATEQHSFRVTYKQQLNCNFRPPLPPPTTHPTPPRTRTVMDFTSLFIDFIGFPFFFS